MYMYLSQTSMLMEHSLRVAGQDSKDKVENCAAEIADYLTDLANWPQPIFPDVAGCSLLMITPAYFEVYGTFWACYFQEDKEGEGIRGSYDCVVP